MELYKNCQEDSHWPPIVRLHCRLHYSGQQSPCKDLYLGKVQFSDYVQYYAFFYCFYITIKTFSNEGDSVFSYCMSFKC